MFKKRLSIILAVIMVLSIFAATPFTADAQEIELAEDGANVELSESSAISQSDFNSRINSLRNSYPNGYYWDGSFDGGIQCYGFARLVAYNVFGSHVNNWSLSYSMNGVKAGDVVQYGNTSGNGHTIFVLSVSGSTIKYVDCNGNGGYCKVRWDDSVTIGAKIFGKYNFSYRYVSPGVDTEPDYTPVNILSGVYVIHSAWDDNVVLDIHGDSTENDANIQLYQRVTTNDVQKFRIIRYGDYYCIKSIFSGLWLDVKLPIGDNSNVKLYYENTNEENDWQFIDAGDGYFYIRNRTGYYLDVQGDKAVNNANIQLYHFIGNNSQKWRLEDVTKYVNTGGVCKIRSAYNDNMCLDIAGNSTEDRANIQLYENTNDDVQKFRIYKEGNYSCFKSVYSGKWLDIALPIQSKANVQLWWNNDSDEDKWIFEDAGNGYVYIQSKTGFYLDLEKDQPVNRANIQMYYFIGNNSQRWRIDDLTTHVPVDEGIYTIHSAWDDNMCLDIEGNSTENRANVILYQYENTTMQKYRIVKNGNYYCLKSIHADRWLDIKTPFNNNSNVQLWGSNNADEEKWIFEDAGNGYVYIRSKLGYYLDLQGDNPVNWANIQIYNYIGSKSQKWKLKRVLQDDMVTVEDVTIDNDSASVNPSVTVKVGNKTLIRDTDYSVTTTVDNSKTKGTITVKGRGSYSGSVKKEFAIKQKRVFGDADGDGEVGAVDVTQIQRYNAMMNTGIDKNVLMNADVDGDGDLTIIDATYIQRWLAHIEVPYTIGQKKEKG